MYLPIIIPVLHAVRHDGGVQFVGRQSRHHLLLETLIHSSILLLLDDLSVTRKARNAVVALLQQSYCRSEGGQYICIVRVCMHVCMLYVLVCMLYVQCTVCMYVFLPLTELCYDAMTSLFINDYSTQH